MRQSLEQLHLLHELSDVLLLQTFESDPLDRVHRSVSEVESSVDGSELTFADAVSETLRSLRTKEGSGGSVLVQRGRVNEEEEEKKRLT